MTSFPNAVFILPSDSSEMHLCLNVPFSASQSPTSAAAAWSALPLVLACKLEILKIYNKLSKEFIINGGNHI